MEGGEHVQQHIDEVLEEGKIIKEDEQVPLKIETVSSTQA